MKHRIIICLTIAALILAGISACGGNQPACGAVAAKPGGPPKPSGGKSTVRFTRSERHDKAKRSGHRHNDQGYPHGPVIEIDHDDDECEDDD